MANVTCPTDCTSALPVVNFNDCAPEVNLSEIEKIFIGKSNATAFDDWTSPTEWATRLSQDDEISDDSIRELVVVGDKPAASTNEITISNGRRISTSKTHTVNFDIDETNDENYEFMRLVECSGQYKIWYKTKGGKLYGGNDGIQANVILNDVLTRGENEIELFQGTITWNDKHHPERVVSPI